MSKRYLHSKLSDINYRMAIHEGNANRRLASESEKILFLLVCIDDIPEDYRVQFSKLTFLIEHTLKKSFGRQPSHIRGIYNKTAAKYIGMLMSIEGEIEDL